MRKAKPTPSRKQLIAWGFSYDPLTGVLSKHGKPIGYQRPDRYVAINMGVGRRYLAHRIAWKLKTGREAPDDVDHWDLDPSNNRWVNLRSATWSQSRQNSKTRSRTGFKGVTMAPRGKYLYFQARCANKMLGYFKTAQEAHAAYCAAADKEFGKFSRHN